MKIRPLHEELPLRHRQIAERAFRAARDVLVETANMRHACATLLDTIAKERPGVTIQPDLWAAALRNPPD